MRGPRRFLMPSFGDVIFLLTFVAALVVGTALTNRDGDLAKHLRVGEWAIENQQFPTIDVWSHTLPGSSMVPFEWLSQTTLAVVERWLGFDGIVLLTALLVSVPFLLIYRWLIRRGAPLGLSFFLIILGAATSVLHWMARPHVFSWIFLAIWIIQLGDLKQGHRRRVWLLIPLTALWVNFHGAWVVGLLLILIHLLGAVLEDLHRGVGAALRTPRVQHLAPVLLGCFAASFLNPSGYHTVIHPFAHVVGDNFIIGVVNEFASPNFHNPLFWPFLAMILLTITAVVRANPTSLMLTVFWTAAGLYSLRHIPLYALIVTPILVEVLTPSWSTKALPSLGNRFKTYSRTERSIVGGSLSIILVGLIAFSLLSSPGSQYEFSNDLFPIDAVETLGEMPPGDRVFNEFIWGGYLLYCCHPDIPVFIDGQVDHYGTELTQDYLMAQGGEPGWRHVLEKHKIDWVLISPEQPLAQVLSESDDWTEIYRDETAVIYVLPS